MKPSIEYLRERIEYNPDTGKLYWKAHATMEPKWSGRYVGKEAFKNEQSAGYLQGMLDYRKYLAHRIAWAIYYGEWPDEVDHINHDKHDNRIANLRSVTRDENGRNTPRHRDSTSDVTGVTYNRRDKKWQVHITYKGALKNIRQFKTFEEAVRRRRAANFLYGFHENHGL